MQALSVSVLFTLVYVSHMNDGEVLDSVTLG
jgi:hypothetical protein